MIAIEIEMKASLLNEPTPEWQIVTSNFFASKSMVKINIYMIIVTFGWLETVVEVAILVNLSNEEIGWSFLIASWIWWYNRN